MAASLQLHNSLNQSKEEEEFEKAMQMSLEDYDPFLVNHIIII
jgi:hypothetical protein